MTSLLDRIYFLDEGKRVEKLLERGDHLDPNEREKRERPEVPKWRSPRVSSCWRWRWCCCRTLLEREMKRADIDMTVSRRGKMVRGQQHGKDLREKTVSAQDKSFYLSRGGANFCHLPSSGFPSSSSLQSSLGNWPRHPPREKQNLMCVLSIHWIRLAFFSFPAVDSERESHFLSCPLQLWVARPFPVVLVVFSTLRRNISRCVIILCRNASLCWEMRFISWTSLFNQTAEWGLLLKIDLKFLTRTGKHEGARQNDLGVRWILFP